MYRKPARAAVRPRELAAEGISRERLRRLTAQGLIERAARGVYLRGEAAQSPHRDLLIVATRVPHGVFCLLTALVFHGLTTEMPHEVWVAIGLKSRAPALDTPPLKIVRLSPALLHAGVEVHVEHGIELRVFSAARTVADCFKFRSRVGIDVAASALRDGWEKKCFTMDELWHYAHLGRVTTVMRPYLEALVG